MSARDVYASTEHSLREALATLPERVRQAVLDRDLAQCQLCGTGGENRLQLHHVEFRSQGGKHVEDNLVTVCFRCHHDIHVGKQDITLIEIEPGVWAAFPGVRRRGT